MSARGEYLAKALQRRDAAAYGPVIQGVQHPTWDEIGDPGREEYLADAEYSINALAVHDRIQFELDADAEGKAYTRAEEHDTDPCD